MPGVMRCVESAKKEGCKVKRPPPAGINYERLLKWLERLENGPKAEAWRELEALPAHVVDVPGTTIESLLNREGRQGRRTAGSDT